MHIHTNHTNQWMQSLVHAISKDPASLEHWRCLHICRVEGAQSDWYEQTVNGLTAAHHDVECDVIHCSPNDVLFISPNLRSSQLYEVTDELVKAISTMDTHHGYITIYDMFQDWKDICRLLEAKSVAESTDEISYDSYDFGDISSAMSVFHEAKKLRMARHPLHVMLVEDDLLTRRIVANSFKEKYAVITASNAQEAVANYLMHAPDIVFLDIGLPDTSGFHALQQIITSDPEAYVVMFSGNSYLETITSALNAGASGFLAKPFLKDKMHHYIQESAIHHHKFM